MPSGRGSDPEVAGSPAAGSEVTVGSPQLQEADRKENHVKHTSAVLNLGCFQGRIMTSIVYMQRDKLVFLASCDRHTLGQNSSSGLFGIKVVYNLELGGNFNTDLQFKHLHQLKEYQTAL